MGIANVAAKNVIDKHLAEGLADLKKGRTHGPYKTAQQAIKALESRVKPLSKDRA